MPFCTFFFFFLSWGWIFFPSLPWGCLDLSSSAFNPVINQEKAIYCHLFFLMSFWKPIFTLWSPPVIWNVCSEQSPSSSRSRCCCFLLFASGAITAPSLLVHRCKNLISWLHLFHTQRMTVGSPKRHLYVVFKFKSVTFSYWCYLSDAPFSTKFWCSREMI